MKHLGNRHCAPFSSITSQRLRRAIIAILAAVVALPATAENGQSCPDSLQPTAPVTPRTIEDPSQQPIKIDSDGVEMATSGDIELKGNVRVRQGERTLSADEITYRAETQDFSAVGVVEYADPQLKVQGESAQVSSTGGATFEGAQFEIIERGARGEASRMSMSARGDVELEDVRYTTCPPGSKDWELKASGIAIDQDSRMGTGRNVRLDFKGIPILYTPVISFPVGNERKSGFLFPVFGTSSRNGTQIAVPWYWNIAPNYDATLMPIWYSSRGAMLDSEFRYLTSNSFGTLLADYLPDDQERGGDRSYVRLTDRTDFTDRLRLDIDAANVSDDLWFEDFGQGPEGTSVIYLDRYAQLTYLTDEWSVSALAQNLQLIDPPTAEDAIAPEDRPYTVVPQLAVSGYMPDRAFGLTYSLDGEVANFDRSTGVTGARLDLEPQIRLPLRRGGVYIEPSAGWRYTAYQLDDTDAGQDRSPSRSAPVASVDTGMVFERLAGQRRQRLQTLEPRVLYVYIPYRNQDDLPVFDTTLPDLNLVQLFRANRYVGPDRLGDANQLSMGLTSRLLDADTGRQFLSATIGQTYYFDTPRVLLPDEVATESSSDIVAQLELSAYKDWYAHMGIQWDPHSTRSERGEVRFQYRPANDQVFNLGYRFRRDSLEQLDTSFAWPIGPTWSAYGRWVYSLQDSKSLDQMAGFQYRSCCWSLRLVAGRSVSSRTGETDTSIQVQLELTGLSSVGVRADAFLERSIRGYSARSTATQTTP